MPTPSFRRDGDLRVDPTRAMTTPMQQLHMSAELSLQFEQINQEVTYLHFAWYEYAGLFGVDQEQANLLNRAASQTIYFIESAMWADLLMGVARLTGPVRSAGQDNLTIQRLPLLVDASMRDAVRGAVEAACKAADFTTRPRHKYFAHRDLATALDRESAAFVLGSRLQMQQALHALVVVLDAVSEPYWGVRNVFPDTSDAARLIEVIRNGLVAHGARIPERPGRALCSSAPAEPSTS